LRHESVKSCEYALELARPTGFEPVTLGLKMQGIEHTNDHVLHRFVILQ